MKALVENAPLPSPARPTSDMKESLEEKFTDLTLHPASETGSSKGAKANFALQTQAVLDLGWFHLDFFDFMVV